MAKDTNPRERVVVGFQGGGALSLKLLPKDLEALLGALGSGGWHEIADADGPVRANLAQVVYVRSETDEQRVGFGLG